MRTIFEAEGDIRSTDVLAALVALWRDATSGTLRFSRSGATSAFELAAGEVIGASSSDPRFDTAAILIRANKLEASTMERLVVPEGADRAYSALEAGILTKREWRWGEKIRAVEVLSDLLTWIEGDYTLVRSGPREAGEFRLTIPRLVLELFLRSRDRGLVLHHLGGADVPLVRDSKFEAEFATFGLTDDAESVVRLIDGESTAADIAAGAPAEAFAVEKLLAALVTLGLVHPAYAVDPETAARETVAFPTPPISEPEPADVGPAAAADVAEEEGAVEEVEDVEEDVRPEENEEEEPLEPEVDISDKLGEPPAIAPAPEYDELPPAVDVEGESHEEMVDARLDASRTDEPLEDVEEVETESERESLAADFEPTRSSPDEYASEEAAAVENFEREPEEHLPAPPLEFQRPLDTSTGVGSLERPRHRSSGTLWILLGMLIAATAAVLYWRARGPSSGAETATPAVAATPSPTLSEQSVEPVATAAPPMVSAASVPAAMATSVPSATGPAPTRVPTSIPTARPSPRPTAKPPTAKPAAAAPTAAPRVVAAPKSRQEWLQRAERDQKSAAANRDARFAIQLELACEVPSLNEAFGHDRPAGNMWVVPTSYRGKTCFRVLWGRYPTREAGESALGSAPAFFSTPRNHPMVVPVR